MDDLICEIYIMHVTPGGQTVWIRVTLAVIHLCRVWIQAPCASTPLHQTFKSSARVLPLTPQLNRIMCKSSLRGKIKSSWMLQTENRWAPNTDLSLLDVSKGSRCILMSRSVRVWPYTLIRSQLILLRLWGQCLPWLRAQHLQRGEYVDELKPHQTVA